jgi:hypothetical protein
MRKCFVRRPDRRSKLGRFHHKRSLVPTSYHPSSNRSYGSNLPAELVEELATTAPDVVESMRPVTTHEVVESTHWNAHLRKDTFTEAPTSGPVDITSSLPVSTRANNDSVACGQVLNIPEDTKANL